jgi:hypothetical protein
MPQGELHELREEWFDIPVASVPILRFFPTTFASTVHRSVCPLSMTLMSDTLW